jgi:hypothetical protein
MIPIIILDDTGQLLPTDKACIKVVKPARYIQIAVWRVCARSVSPGLFAPVQCFGENTGPLAVNHD